jgi:hypothetical protein
MACGDTSNVARRVSQMVELGVFRDVLAELRREINLARGRLGPWQETPPAHRLRELAGVLEGQALALRADA